MARGRPKKVVEKQYDWFYSDYIADFENSDCEVIIDGYKVLLPKPQPDHKCLNYGLPIEDQKWPDMRIPKDLFSWDAAEIEAYADNYFHKRKNGFWMFIKGQKLYISGLNFWHLSAWVMKNRKAPEFKYTDSKWFLCWMQAVRTPNCFGLVSIAARRDGKNERTLSMIAEYATRVSSVWCGMQSITEKHVYDNSFSRIAFCINLLHPLVKPINKGNTEGSSVIEFTYPVQIISKNKLMEKQKKGEVATINTEEDYLYPPLGSKIDYAPSRPSSYDGGRLERYLRDEFGKDEEANPYNTWMDHVREAMIDKTFGTVIGKAHFQTTTEEMGKIAQSMIWAKQIWDESDQNKPINDKGDTITGMHRIFRSASDTAQIDEWGFPLKEDKIREIVERTDALLKRGMVKQAIKYRRKNPLFIEDVWKLTGESSLIPTEKLEIRLNNLSLPEYSLKVAVSGTLAWKDGVRDSEVVWMPSNDGIWQISKHPHQVSKLLGRPDISANCVDRSGYTKRPGLIDVFTGGCDPYDTRSDGEAKDLSLGGIAIRLKFFPQIDGQKFDFDEAVQDYVPSNGGENWETDQYVCDYLHRHDNPEDFYEDLIKTCVYYGCYVLTERQKQAALVTYFTHRGYLGYLMERPQETAPSNRTDHQYGMPSTPETISMYDGLMAAEAVRKPNTNCHPRILMQAIQVTNQTRTKMDLYVACGFSNVAAKSIVVKTSEEEKLAGGLFFEERVV